MLVSKVWSWYYLAVELELHRTKQRTALHETARCHHELTDAEREKRNVAVTVCTKRILVTHDWNIGTIYLCDLSI